MTTPAGWSPLTGPPPPVVPSPFARLARTHALALAGDALVTMALAGSLFFSISPTAARGRVALSLVLTMAPFAVVAPLLGPAIDRSRWGRRAMVVLACGGRAVVCLLMARVLDSLLLFPAALAVLILSKGYSVAKSSLVPSAVDSEHELVEANAKLSIVGVVGGFLAAGPGVAVLQLAGAEWVLRLAAVVFVVAGVVGLRIVEQRDDPEARGGTEGEPARPSGVAALRAPRRHELAPPVTVVAAAVAMALLRAVVGFLTFLIAFEFRRAGAAPWWFGLVLAASMAAGLLGAAVAPGLRRRFPEEAMLATCLGACAAAGLVLSQLDGWGWAALMSAVVGVTAAAGKLAFDALVQRDAPQAVRARSFARFEAGFQLVWVVGALLPVVIATPLALGYGAIGIGCATATVAYVLAGRRLRPRPAGSAPDHGALSPKSLGNPQ